MRRSLLLLALFLTTAGCTSIKFPQYASNGMHIYVSTALSPKRLKVIDTLTRKTLWTLPVPVNQKAAVQFKYGTTWLPTLSGATGPEAMRWGVFELDQDYILGELENELELEGNPVRIEVTIDKPNRVTSVNRQIKRP
ncbi:MAG: hypothetical protein R3236_00305 [Phycisphaeraceae bacterium]|nr:hypothetical protein [Phycisphaeraceae bacterium]